MCTTQADWKKVSLLDFFALYYIVTLAIELITGHVIKFCKIPRQLGNFALTGKFRGSAWNYMARGKVWAQLIMLAITSRKYTMSILSGICLYVHLSVLVAYSPWLTRGQNATCPAYILAWQGEPTYLLSLFDRTVLQSLFLTWLNTG